MSARASMTAALRRDGVAMVGLDHVRPRWPRIRHDPMDDERQRADASDVTEQLMPLGSVMAAPDMGALPSPSPVPSIAATSRAIVSQAFEDHQRQVHSFALHATRSAEIAEDVTQEAFLRLMAEVSSGRIPDSIPAWLFRVASNLIISRGRRQTSANRWLRSIARPEVEDETPERTTIRRETHAAVEAALAELAPDARVALLLAAQGFSGREIAETIGRSEIATRTLMCRARLDLRRRLEAPDGSR
jgi:RNA polymerase sigma-70 factor (ECF subfamily)